MIDTDKYEGHTEGEWMFDSRDWNWAINIFGNNGKTIEANAILIQDAPLLLAEVKRLQYWDEEMDRVIATIDEHSWGSSDGDVHEIVTHLLAEVKRLRKELQTTQSNFSMVIEYLNDQPSVHRHILEMIGEWIE